MQNWIIDVPEILFFLFLIIFLLHYIALCIIFYVL